MSGITIKITLIKGVDDACSTCIIKTPAKIMSEIRMLCKGIIPFLSRRGTSKEPAMIVSWKVAATSQPGPYTVANVRDRKSTRLNSSHVAISYAVFCLKKKIIIIFMMEAHEVHVDEV